MIPIQRSMSIESWAYLILLSLLWGGSFFFIELLLPALSPFYIVSFRLALGALTLCAIIYFMRLELPSEPRVYLGFVVMGLLNNIIPFSLIVWGQTQLTSSMASTLNATTPLFTVMIATSFLKDERTDALKLAGVFLGFAGVAYMMSDQHSVGEGNKVLAMCAILGAALSYAISGVFGRRFQRYRVKPIVSAAGQLCTASLILLFTTPFVAPVDLSALSATSWISLAGLGCLSTALAYVLYFHILGTSGATNVLLVTFLVPVSASALGIMFLNEQLTSTLLTGMSAIALGIVLIDGRLVRFIRSQTRIN